MGGVQTQSPPAYEDRTAAFAAGHGMPTTSPGLSQDQQTMNSSGPARIKPSLSANGMAASTYSSTMGGAFPTQNGISSDQYEQAKFMMHKD
jgi:hypothetical protein